MSWGGAPWEGRGCSCLGIGGVGRENPVGRVRGVLDLGRSYSGFLR